MELKVSVTLKFQSKNLNLCKLIERGFSSAMIKIFCFFIFNFNHCIFQMFESMIKTINSYINHQSTQNWAPTTYSIQINQKFVLFYRNQIDSIKRWLLWLHHSQNGSGFLPLCVISRTFLTFHLENSIQCVI